MSVANTIPDRLNVVIYLKSIFFSEKFTYIDIEICENKKQLGILNYAVQRLFYNRLLRILKVGSFTWNSFLFPGRVFTLFTCVK